MSNHKSSVQELEGFPPSYVARCNCRWTGKQTRQKWEAEDEEREHQEKVQRVLALLRPRAHTASLVKSERDYYREKADDPDETEENRVLWRQLADELDTRVRDRRPTQDEGLW